ncbi:MAG TPA: alpha/beta fold hydrolase [Burkholderiales bacterium]|nr:alpha/beta fold hydrolase [Burkholderiales bacterium]
MRSRLPGRAAAAASVITGILIMAGCASSSQEKTIALAEQGSFFVAGRTVQGKGVYDPAKQTGNTNEGNTFWADQMYVQFQIPANPRKYPLVLVHGGGGTGRVWETTPDGREGYQTLFLRRGFAVYIVDFPRRGRAGFPSYNGSFGEVDGTTIVPNRTNRAGVQYAWSRWRLGPKYPEVFPVQQFPMKGLDQFMQHLVPTVSDDPEIISGALVALLEKIGPAILVTHSQSGLFGWLAGARSPNVKGIVAYEPGFVFPKGEMPAPIPLYKGTQVAGTAVTPAEFANLAKMPVQVVYGDNIPKSPIPDLVADGRRAQEVTSRLFVQALNGKGGRASVLLLPDAGLYGNSHFMFSDLNNIEVAEQLSAFLRVQKLDER